MKTKQKLLKAALALASWPLAAVAQSQMVCGLDVHMSPTGFPEAAQTQSRLAAAADACADGTTVFGPVVYERSTGKPVMETSEFTLDADSEVCVIAQSSDKGKGFLYLDGARTAEPEDFDDGVEMQRFSLAAGSHGHGIELVGKPGESVVVEIRRAAGDGGGDPGVPAPGEIRFDPATGALDMVSADGRVRLQNVATDHPLLTPNGDGHHDTTEFQALTTPLVDLPGKDDGSIAYFVDWTFDVIDLDTCATIDTGLSGQKQINSPTLVNVTWAGTDLNGLYLTRGNYAYRFNGTVLSQDGLWYGDIRSPAFGLIIDDSPTITDYDERAERTYFCDPSTDPTHCVCPGVDGEPGAVDPNCHFAYANELLPEATFPPGITPNYMDPGAVDLSFITTTQDPVSGRYTVTADLRDYNAGGLVPFLFGVFSSTSELRQWVADMTGVPADADDSLFNFDFVQVGVSTRIDNFGFGISDFNHFLLDAFTNGSGDLYLLTEQTYTNVFTAFNDDAQAGDEYQVAGRAGDECSNSGNTDGAHSLRGKFCAFNISVPISVPATEPPLGLHLLRTTVFDVQFDNEQAFQDYHCVFDPVFVCGIRTQAVPADTLEIDATYYKDDGAGAEQVRTRTDQVSNATGLSVTVDRNDPEGVLDGVCARSAAVKDGIAIRMSAADGAVPDTCIINGIF